MTNYKEFKIGDLFYISTGRDVIISQTQKGDIPLISNQHSNNGITKYIKRLDNRVLYDHKKTIALADRGVFLATSQKKDFHIGTRVKALTFKSGEQSENVRLFFVTAINKLQTLFEEYLTNATDKLPSLSIMLPITENDGIDYEYMEKYIEKQKEQPIGKVKKYLELHYNNNCQLTEEEAEALMKFQKEEVIYKEYKIEDLFTSENGDTDIQQIHLNNKGNYIVSAGEQNNGIIGKSDIPAKVFDADTITIDMFGIPNFRDYQYKMVTHARVFSLKYKEKKLTIEEGIYLTSQFQYFKQIYFYSNMASWEKIKDKFIRLPITVEGEIDYQFINNFIKAEEKIIIKKIIDYKEKASD